MGVRLTVTAPGRWALEDSGGMPQDVEDAEDVLLRLVSAGICGGDLALLRGENAVARYPLVLGHECVGRVVEAGPGGSFVPGEFAVVFPTSSCGSCQACRDGRVNQCPSMRVRGLSHPSGCFADHLTVPAAQLIPVPAPVAERYGALIEPVAVACHVAVRAAPLTGSVLVIGAGVIGSLLGQVARWRGATTVLAADRYESRRANALALGADGFTTASGPELVEWVAREVGPVDVVLDTVCAAATVDVATEVLRPGGRLVTVASSMAGQRLSPRYDRVFLKELSIVAARNYTPADFTAAVDVLAAEQPNLSSLVTARYPLDRFDEALADLTEAPERHLKVLLGPSSPSFVAARAGVR